MGSVDRKCRDDGASIGRPRSDVDLVDSNARPLVPSGAAN